MSTTTINKWRIFCTTSNKFEFTWQESAPSTCPINGGHSVISGSVSKLESIKVITITNADSPYTLMDRSVYCDTTSGNIIVNLNKTVRTKNARLLIKKTATANTVTIVPYGAELINAGANLVLTNLNESVIIESSGTAWATIDISSIIYEMETRDAITITTDKGDLLIDDGAIMSILNVGSNNKVIISDSSQSTGVKWDILDHTLLSSVGSNTHAQIDTHISASTVHGVSGNIVGTSDSQTLTNKTINFDLNTITNIDNANVKSGAAIDASKIANGSVSNTKFQYLNGVTSDIQTQLGTKIEDGINIGTGIPIFKQKTGTDLELKKITGTSNIRVASTPVTICYDFENDVTDTMGFQDGTIIGGVSFTTGKIGTKCANFDGVSGTMITVDSLDVPNTSEFSISCWFKVTTFSDARLVSKANGTSTSNHVFSLDVPSSAGVSFKLTTGSLGTGTEITGTTGLVTGTWYHMIAWYDGTNYKIYLNGSEDAIAAKTGIVPTSDSINTSIGNQPPGGGGDRAFDGKLDQVIFWNRALISQEIADLYNGGSGRDISYFTDDNVSFQVIESALSLDSIGGTLSVSKGGTGQTTFTSNKFLHGNGTSAVTATKTIPSGTVVGTTDSQTLTNKTLTSATLTTPIISTISNTGTLTLPTSTDTLVGRSTIDTLTNKTLTGATLTSPIISTISNTGTLTLPTSTDTLVGRITTDTLTNKTINTASNTITIATADVTSGTFANARISQSSVTQHQGAIDHGSILGLADDDHTQYALLAGRSGGQTIKGGTVASNNLILDSTSHATKGNIILNDITLTKKRAVINDQGYATTYDASIQSGATSAWLEILNNGGTNKGVFFGIQDNNFELWSYQGGDILYYVDPVATNGTVKYTMQKDGIFRIHDLNAGVVKSSATGTLSSESTGTSFNKSFGTSAGTVTEGNHTTTASGIHGVTGSIVGTTDAQTLTNKTWGDNLNMNSNKITNLATPTADSDAATKLYVDGVATGLDFKESVRVASTVDLDSNGSISGTITYNATAGTSSRGQITATLSVSDTFTVDGVNFGAAKNGSRILLMNQTSGAQNGIWTTTVSGTSLILDRATDFDSDIEVTSGAFTFITEGTTYDNCGFVLATNDPITIGGNSGTPLTFSHFSGAGQITAGTGLTKTGDVINVIGSTTIIANADSLEVNSSITANQVLLSSGSVGIASAFGQLPLGDSNAVTGTLPVSRGGSGATSLTSGKFLQGNGTGAFTATKSVPSGAVVGTTDAQTLTNKYLDEETTEIRCSTTPSSIMVFECQANSSTTTTLQYTSTANRTISLPDATTTLVGHNNSQVLTNKTINTSNNTITIAAADVNSGTFSNSRISAGNVTQHEGALNINNLSGAPTGPVVGTTDAQTLTNKTLTSPILTSAVLTVPKINDTSSDHQYIFGVSELTLDRTVTLPLLTGNDTFAFANHSQTLTNKSIDSDNNTITNIDNADIKSGASIDATKIANGSVTNTEFQYLNSITGDVQSQLDGKIPYFETNLICVENGSPGNTDHVKFCVTKNTLGDIYNMRLDTGDPCRVYFTTEDGTYRQAVILSSDGSGSSTIFGVSRSINAGSSWQPVLVATQNQRVGINNNSPSDTLDVSGNIVLSGTVDGRDIAVDGTAQDSHIAASTGVHGVSGSVVGTSDSQILTNKTLIDSTTYFQDNTDASKKLQFQLSGITTGTTRILTIPDANTTIVGTDLTQTLTNKILTTPKITTSINDTNDNELLKVTPTSSAINELTLANAATGSGPTLSATGGDTNIDFNINPKGTGKIVLDGLKWPNADGTANQVLKTDGSGNIGYANVDIANIDTVTTTDATITTITSSATLSDTTYVVEVTIVGRRTDTGSESAGYVFKALYRNNGGTLTKVSEDRLAMEDTKIWNATLDVSGTNIIAQVKGEASKTINWKSSCKILSVL